MHWVEIINARMMADFLEHQKPEFFFEMIQASAEAEKNKQVQLIIYRNGLIENDWSIHLHWQMDRQPPEKTELGIKLANIIRPLALVDHTIWVESLKTLNNPVPCPPAA